MHKKFLIRLLVFLALLVSINILLDQLYKRCVVHNILNNAKDRDFRQYNDTLRYLSLGNSHNTVDTYVLENAFNYNSPAENYVQSYYKLKYIVEEQKKIPENLILYIDVSSFSAMAAGYFEHNSYWIKYVDYFEVARVMGDRHILNKWLEGNFFSYAGNYRNIKLSLIYLVKIGHLNLHHGYRAPRNFKNFAYYRPEDIDILSDESQYDWTGARETDRKEKVRRAKRKADIYLTRKGYFDHTMATYFEKILHLCLDHDIQVILLRAPLTREYWEEVNRIVPAGKLYEKVRNIYTRYPNVTMVLDYHDLFFDHPEYFFDPDHLNPLGARLFTQQLQQDLKKSAKTQK